MRVALIHDYLNQWGGAEKVLSAFCEIWPDAPIFTLIYDRKATRNCFDDKKIYTSFLQKFPFIKKNHRLFLMFMPQAIESFDLSRYDIVLSDSASYAKGVITRPETLHISYCHTPLRYVWDDSQRYVDEFCFPSIIKRVSSAPRSWIRIWDKEAASRVDKFIANSEFVRKRIKKYYGFDSEVIHPPLNSDNFSIQKTSNYFLMVGRLLPYKRFDLAIETFNKLRWPLKIIGDGPDKKRLKRMAKDNIEFLGEITSDFALAKYYSRALALLFPQEEDFGIVALEAMASGRPVIAYAGGGALETVVDGKTGLFFDEQSPGALEETVRKFNPGDFDSQLIRQHALKFDKEIFKKKIKNFVEDSWKEFKGIC